MSDSDAAAAAAMAAAMAAALRTFNTEIWTLFSLAFTITCVRTYARIKAVGGLVDLAWDDYGIWLATLFHLTQTTLAFFVVNKAGGVANNSMTDEERAALVVGSTEYNNRVVGSKIQVAGWTMYMCLIFVLKMCMLVFYTRLTSGLGRRYRMQIHAGFITTIVVFLVSIITTYTACHPFPKYWQINPDPGNVCQAAVSMPIVWVSLVSSIITDIYLILIPLPMLWSSSLKPIKKIASTIVLGAGIFVLVCSVLKTVFVMTDPVNGAQLAGQWGVREAFVSVVITNLPMIFPLLRAALQPFFGSMISSTAKQYKTPDGFRTIGGGLASGSAAIGKSSVTKGTVSGTSTRHGRLGRSGSNNFGGMTNMSNNSSEEQMVQGIRMENVVYGGRTSSPSSVPSKGIVMTSEFQLDSTDAKHP